ncbi:unnamed protein product [Effrenium voratum]|uniref:Signal recognition particle subunit SRP68 n=1 Tax=Effrenium voratum TaxID=2562239 RepID=A0AA36N6U8_9DINO|nr:unnamed protein product [Effrenium voratum]
MASETPEAQEEPQAPTHEPFSMKLLSTVQEHRSLNGLRHNDHLRYRQYCSRRLRRLYTGLRFTHGKTRFKQVPFPENIEDAKWVCIPLVQTERAWAFGVQLKADNAAASADNLRWRRHSERKFRKAHFYAQHLESVCKVHFDQRTQLEAEAYAAYISGTWLKERENWAEAKTKLARCKKLCEHFQLGADQAEAAALRTYLEELAPMLRECRYNLGEGEEEEDALKVAAGKKIAQERSPSSPKSACWATLSEAVQGDMVYRGHPVSIPSDKIRSTVMSCLESAKALQADTDSQDGGPVATEKYGELSVNFGDVLKDVRGEMMAAGADADIAEWRIAEAFIREVSIGLSAERNLMLLRGHLAKMDDIEDVNSIDSRRHCRPEEGMRFCELVKEDLAALTELPESSGEFEAALTAYKKVIQDYRCLYLALCHTAIGKLLEAAALLDLLSNRIEEAGNEGPLPRLQKLFQQMQEPLQSRVARWRCRVLVLLAKAHKKKQESEVEEPTAAEQTKAKQDPLATFPPTFRDVPCKPLLFDLAFPCIQPPNLDEILPKKQEGKGRQAVAAVAGALGGLGSRLGGWMGRK